MSQREITNQEIPILAKSIITEYLYKTKPELIGKGDITNKYFNFESGLDSLYDGKTEAKADRKSQVKEFDPKNLQKGDVTSINGVLYRITGDNPDAPDYLEELK